MKANKAYHISYVLHGLPASAGIAIGRAHLLSHASLEVSHLTILPRQIDKEIERFKSAILKVQEELLAISKQAGTADLSAFVDLHLSLLADPLLSEIPKDIIKERHCNAEWALVQQMETLVAEFEAIEDIYLRERSFDVRQVVERVVAELAGIKGGKSAPIKGDARILVAHDLSPADIMSLKEEDCISFITDVGGLTSHTAILAKSMRLPAVLAMHNARAMIAEDELLIVDGVKGLVIVNPDTRVLEEYRLRQNQFDLERSKLRLLKTAHATSLDQVRVDLLANIEEPKDIAIALENGAEGVGLFRTEFLCLGKGDFPSEDEQFEIYRKAAQALHGLPLTIRTFDLGNDKNIASDTFLDERKRHNSALGLRSIRLSLAEPQHFHAQLRAVLRASRYGKMRLLFPMISHTQQIDQTLWAIEEAKNSLRADKLLFDAHIPLGAMIEVPAAAIALKMFVGKLDFISIGTNDLIQYALAVERGDEQVAHLYDPLHPGVLWLLAHIMETACKAGLPVSMCGELAGDLKMTRLLLGMGLRQFSMHPALIPEIKQCIKQTDLSQIAPLIKKVLKQTEPHKIRAQMSRLNELFTH